MELTYKHKYYLFFLGYISALLIIYLSPIPTTENHVTLCVIHNITGYPCPACGTGRALIFLRHGQFYNALIYNPLAYIVLVLSIIGILLMVKDLITKEQKFVQILTTKVHPLIIIVIFVFTIANGIWNLYKGL